MLDMLRNFEFLGLPRICMVCGFTSEDHCLDLCKYCKAFLPWLDDRCYRCGGSFLQPHEGMICDQCEHNPPPYERLCALFSYDPPLNNLINRFKFNRDLYPGKLFAQLLQAAILEEWYMRKSLPQLIIPVPLHPNRQRYRGYNQALEICLPLAKVLNIPLGANTCRRIRNTPAQARLARTQRITNLYNSFTVTNCSYEHVVIVDDVVTTASTVRAVSLALLAAGVQNVEVWCVCRA